jgi:hypothetical protein
MSIREASPLREYPTLPAGGEQLVHANCRFQRSGSPQKGSISDPDMLQTLAAFALLRRSAYPVVEL